MAVYQISKIQVRRGRKNTGTSVPQLASGEIGWAVDTQQLYIGNGSVAEGAPYVGNTEILTEHSNILDIASLYQYRKHDDYIQTGLYSTDPIERSLQDRLDDVVSVRAFGAIGNGIADDTDALQRAINQLYLNADKSAQESRKILYILPGVYKIREPLRVPPYAEIHGAGKDKTVIRQIGDCPVLITVGTSLTTTDVGDWADLADLEPQNQPQYISMSGITFEHTKNGYPIIELQSTKKSSFTKLKLKGIWETHDALSASEMGVSMKVTNSLVTCEFNEFDDCEFTNISYAVKTDFDVKHNNFNNCVFEQLGAGIVFGTSSALPPATHQGPCLNKITNSRFVDIDEHGIAVWCGAGNISDSNTFSHVGNNGGSSLTAYHPVIQFTESSNVSRNDYFERSVDLSNAHDELYNSSEFVGEFGGTVDGEHRFNKEVCPVYSETANKLIRLSAFASYVVYKLHYLFKSNPTNIVRSGQLTVVIDKNNSTLPVRLTDEFDVNGNFSDAEQLVFTSNIDETLSNTVNILYTNNSGNDVDDDNSLVTLTYWYEVIS